MSFNIYNIKKWTKMLIGKSILHVNQNKGRIYSKEDILGYYNDLTEKVTKSNLKVNELPKIKDINGNENEFSIAIFQYGLGAYDMFLIEKKEEYLKRFEMAVDWAMKNQLENGGWVSFEKTSPNNPFSAMAQGEGASILLRAYKQFEDNKYLKAARKAIYFMIKSDQEGGTALYKDEEVYLKEFANDPIVLNGWIFSVFGIYDYLLINGNDKFIKEIYYKTVDTLIKSLEKFDLGYWSKYDIEKKVASPFYHKLHSALLYVLEELTGKSEFKKYAKKFEKYGENIIFKMKAFSIKALQKIKEK